MYKTGWNVGCEFEIYSKPFAYFAEFNMNFTKHKETCYTNDEANTKIVAELTAGPRYILLLGKIKPFFDIGAGAYVAKYKINVTHIGISSGIGLLFNIYKNFDIITKFKYHPHLVVGDGVNIVDYIGIYGGIKYNL